MRFFGIPDPELRSRGFGIGIFYFGLDRKIPKITKSLGSGSGFENPEKFQVKNPENPEISDRDLFFRDNLKFNTKQEKVNHFREISGIYANFFGIFYLWDVPGIF